MLYINSQIDIVNHIMANVHHIKPTRTKKAWKNFYRRHKGCCIDSASMHYGEDKEIPMRVKDFVNRLITDGDLNPVKKA